MHVLMRPSLLLERLAISPCLVRVRSPILVRRVVNGDLGVSPGTAVTGFPPGIVIGTIHAADAVALQAQKDAATAYVNAAGQPCDVNLTGQDLGGKTLTSGVYCFSSSATQEQYHAHIATLLVRIYYSFKL